MNIGVTGANGFVGSHVVRALKNAGHFVRALVRSPNARVTGADETHAIPSIGPGVDAGMLKKGVSGLDTVVHLAAHVHVMDRSLDEKAFHDVNVSGSVLLAQSCAAMGVGRFVFMSSVKAAGERSLTNQPLHADGTPSPEDAYGRSKLAAEQILAQTSADLSMGLVILRPTFVYGWPPAGNFRAVIAAVKRGTPLPLAGISNRRDMIYVGNLADAVLAAASSADIGRGPYFVCDGDSVSTTDLFRRTAQAFNRPSRLFPVPTWALRIAGAVTGKNATIQRLTENLEVDSAPFRRDAGWQPPYKMSEALAEIAAAAETSLSEPTKVETS